MLTVTATKYNMNIQIQGQGHMVTNPDTLSDMEGLHYWSVHNKI